VGLPGGQVGAGGRRADRAARGAGERARADASAGGGCRAGEQPGDLAVAVFGRIGS